MQNNYARFVLLLLAFSSLTCEVLLSSSTNVFLASGSGVDLSEKQPLKMTEGLIGDAKGGGNRLVATLKSDSGDSFKYYQSGKDYYKRKVSSNTFIKVDLNSFTNCQNFINDWLPNKYQNMLQLLFRRDNLSTAKRLNSAINLSDLNWEESKGDFPLDWQDKKIGWFQNKFCKTMERVLSEYYENGALKRYCEKMAEFYYYICVLNKCEAVTTLVPSWNSMPDEDYGRRLSDSAVHTEFMMVYDLIQSDGELSKSFNEFNFEALVKGLCGKLPKKIYSAKAMCPVCEAFLTSLYNVCGCEGVFISKLNDYNSPSGPAGALKKVYLNKTKDGTYVDLPPGHEKAAPVTNSHKIKPY